MFRIAALVAGLLVACAEPTPRWGDDCRTNEQCPDGTCVFGRCVAADAVDVSGADDLDASPDDPDSAVDLPVDDTLDEDVEVWSDFGTPCNTNDDCDSGYCIESDEGRICTDICNDNCPPGWACRLLVESGADAVHICVPEGQSLCRPCTNDTQCGSVFSACLQQDNGRFCATDCSQTRECPEEYLCNYHLERQGGEEVESWLCEPQDSACAPLRLFEGTFNSATGSVQSTTFVLSGYLTFEHPTVSSPSFRLTGGY